MPGKSGRFGAPDRFALKSGQPFFCPLFSLSDIRSAVLTVMTQPFTAPR